MQFTDIKVYGWARDVRIPDRAEVRLQVSRWGRDWQSMHQSVAGAVGALTEAVHRFEAENPQALSSHNIGQVSQRTWVDDIGTAYSETVDVIMVFTDFYIMSQWLFHQSPDLFQIHSIRWNLSATARTEMDIALSVEAVRDARRKAETYAVAAGLVLVGVQTLSDPEPDEETDPLVTEPAISVASSNGRSTGGSRLNIDITPLPIETQTRIAVHYLAAPDPERSTFPVVQQPAEQPV